MVHFFYWGTSLAEVCELLAFDSAGYFSTLFKSIVGVSPGAFRKACLALDADERTELNTNTHLFTAGPIPLNDMITSMKLLVASIMKTTL